MTIQEQYTATARQTQEAWTAAAESWASTALQTLQRPVSRFQSIDTTVVVDQFFDFAQHVLEINRQYVKNLTQGASAIQGAVREHVGSLGEAVRDQVETTVETARDSATKVVEQAKAAEEAAEQEARDEARAAARAERAEARQAEKAARDEAAEKYADLTKVELQDLLAERDLPKTGNVDELRARLIDADVASVNA